MDKKKLIQLTNNDINNIGLSSFNQFGISDERGSLSILHESDQDFQINGFSIKESFSYKGSARGLHMQDLKTSPQIKIIEVLEGAILDFVFDINNPDFVYFFELNDLDKKSVFIPSNFAHGFIALANVRFRYSCFGRYDEKSETTFNLLKSAADCLNITDVVLSAKDQAFPELYCEL